MKKKNIFLISIIVCLFSNIKIVIAQETYNKEAGEHLNKIVYNEFGENLESDSNANYSTKLTADSIVLNNTNNTTNNKENSVSNNKDDDKNSIFAYDHICKTPAVLRVISFFMLIIDIVKIIIPIGLIVIGIISFSKAVIANDEKAQKKAFGLFSKRLLYAVLVFVVPWIVEVLMITLGNLAVTDNTEVNFTDCIENANSETIKNIENGTYGWSCYVCKTDESLKVYKEQKPPKGILCKNWKETDLSKEECK